MKPALPVDEHLGRILDAVRTRRAAVVVAPPGSGKTTRVPPALVDDGPVILLQPRRVAARNLARWIAQEQGWSPGVEVGWQVRFEKNFSRKTRLLLATEGILNARLRSDPLLEDFRTVILDEFHERSLHADLALALVKQAAAARDDLRIVVMSATLEARAVSDYLNGCPILQVPGSVYPVQLEYQPQLDACAAVRRCLESDEGHVLCFLPGAREIHSVADRLRPDAARRASEVYPLYGALTAAEQDRAVARSDRRKVVLATNIAETSLTVEGVTHVVDSGLHKVLRLDAACGIDRLEQERISEDSATQRAGRAGRTGPGVAIRLWDPRERLRPHREPEIQRVELSRAFLELLGWGGQPQRFDWFEPPDETRAGEAMELLQKLGALDGERIGRLGRDLLRFPTHPRLARILLDCAGDAAAAAACAILSEGWNPRGDADMTGTNLMARVDRIDRAPAHLRRSAAEFRRIASDLPSTESETVDRSGSEERLARAISHAFPDRLARRRSPGSPRLLLASGHGARLPAHDDLIQAEFLVALDLAAGNRGPGSEARVRLACAVERDWIVPTDEELHHEFDAASGRVRAFRRKRFHSLVLAEAPATADPDIAAGLLARELERNGLDERAQTLLRRIRFAGVEFDLEQALRDACLGRTSLPEVDPLKLLPYDKRERVERLAPRSLPLPRGRRMRLEYRDDGTVHGSAKLQHLFGVHETPRLGPKKQPVTVSLLAPNGRPAQTTRDLRSFWATTYAEVRKELRGRYPKHDWPENPY